WAQQCDLSHNGSKQDKHSFDTRAPLTNNWIHLFIDGAMRRGSRSTFVDRVLRDQNGNWILGYNHYLRKCTVF
ncbi:hypothetical protein Goarm_022122, partial [Gossypium armourianum]|nr:hypothetical protein [Gossypium armourianum]